MTNNKTPTLALVLFILLSSGLPTRAAAIIDQTAEEIIGGPPTAVVCGKTKGEVKKDELLKMNSIQLRGCVETAKVTGFKLTVIQVRKDGEKTVVSQTADKGILSESMKVMIRDAQIGSKIYFENINVVDADGKMYDVEPVVVIVG